MIFDIEKSIEICGLLFSTFSILLFYYKQNLSPKVFINSIFIVFHSLMPLAHFSANPLLSNKEP